VLEVSLRKAGYSVAGCSDAQSALELLSLSRPDLILADTRLPETNGFELLEQIRADEEWSDIPFIFLASDVAVESKIRGLELGVEDYLTKPIYIKEIITRVNLVLQRKQREGMSQRDSLTGKARFTGSLADMGLVDLIQTIDIGKKTGVLYLSSGKQRGAIYFRDGALVDAELGRLRGARAVYRALVLSSGSFEIDFRPVRMEDAIKASSQAVLMEGMRRMDEWGRFMEQLPPLETVFEVNEKALIERLAEIPDEINETLRHVDGKNSLIGILESASPTDDLEVLAAISKLYFEGIIFDTGRKTSVIPGPLEEGPKEEEGRPATSPPRRPTTTLGAAAFSGAADRGTEARGEGPGGGPAAADGRAAGGAGGGEEPAAPGGFERGPSTLEYPVAREKKQTPPYGTPITALYGPDEAASGETAEGGTAAPPAGRGRVIRFPQQEQSGANGVGEAVRSLEGKKVARPPVPSGVPIGDRKSGSRARGPAAGSGATASAGPGAAADLPAIPSLVRFPQAKRRGKRLRITSSSGTLVSPVYRPPAPDEPEAEKRAPAFDPAGARAARSEDELALREADLEQIGMVSMRPRSKPAPPPVPERQRITEPEVESDKTRATSPEVESPRRAEPDGQSEPAAKADKGAEPASEPEVAIPAVRLVSRKSEGASAAREKPGESETAEEEIGYSTIPVSAGARMTRMALVVLGLLTLSVVGVYLFYPPADSGEERASGAIDSRATASEEPPPTAPGAALSQDGVGPQAERAGEKQGPEQGAATEQAEEPGQAEEEPGQAAAASVEVGEPRLEQPEESGDEERYAELVEEARKLEAKGKRRRAVELYEQALAVRQDGSEALGKLAFHYLNQGDNGTAADYAARAAVEDPTSSEAWIVLGAARDGLKDREGAREAYRKCVELGKGIYVQECRRLLR
jgi:CheY-like chemotaxis protein